MLLQTTNH